jgi:hypothetical protein
MIAATCFVFLFPLGVSAQPTFDNDRDVPTTGSWQRLEQLSVQLDRQAARARVEARADQRHHGSEEFAERLDDFAKEAHRFRALVDDRHVPSSKINDELRKLTDQARKVQRESVKAERHDPRTDADWNRAVATLDQIDHQYMAANGLARPGELRERYPADRERHEPDTVAPPTTSSARPIPLGDVDRRAADAVRLSESANLDITPDIERLRDELRSFEQDGPRMTPDDRRADLEQMLSQARAVQADLSGSNAPQQVRDDVDAVVDTLAQERDGETTAVGTSGYGPPSASDRDAYAAMDVPQLVHELDNRVARAGDVTAPAGLDELSRRVADFANRVRDFDNRAAGMSPEDRRETVDGLLRDAQRTQRDLAGRHVSNDVMSRWNDVVNLLAYLRARS